MSCPKEPLASLSLAFAAFPVRQLGVRHHFPKFYGILAITRKKGVSVGWSLMTSSTYKHENQGPGLPDRGLEKSVSCARVLSRWAEH